MWFGNKVRICIKEELGCKVNYDGDDVGYVRYLKVGVDSYVL